MSEIWSLDYRSENISNDVLHFSINIIGFEFQQLDFLTFFPPTRFIRKSVQTFISTSLYSKISSFYRKMDNITWFSVIKRSTPRNFRCLLSKLTSEICQREGFKCKIHLKSAQNVNFHFFSRKITTFK